MSEPESPGSPDVPPTQTAAARSTGPGAALSNAATGDDAAAEAAAAPGLEIAALRFAEYVEPQIDVLLRVATSLTGRNGGAEDLVQETLIRAYRAIESFDGAYPRAWLLTILRRTHINMNRRQRPIVIEDFEATHRARPAFGPNEQDGPEDQVLAGTLHPRLHNAVASLDARFRTVLLLVDVDGLSYAEAAAVLDVPVGTVMSRLSRARNRVRDHLGPDVMKARRL
ncbi:MAG: sigma-70 family RNA polymerase sigma factor [Ornithinimicrobium sp.]